VETKGPRSKLLAFSYSVIIINDDAGMFAIDYSRAASAVSFRFLPIGIKTNHTVNILLNRVVLFYVWYNVRESVRLTTDSDPLWAGVRGDPLVVNYDQQ